MKIKITKSERPEYWYANHIGEIFEVEEITKDNDYIVSCDGDYNEVYFVTETDCIIVSKNKDYER
jgi:hypothetical protein